jgi:hypothetical protein
MGMYEGRVGGIDVGTDVGTDELIERGKAIPLKKRNNGRKILTKFFLSEFCYSQYWGVKTPRCSL